MSFISKKCDKCGSTEHSLVNCPHSFFSNECSKCGSKEHVLENCPNSFFSNECQKCGSKEHNLQNCPHNFFNDKCTKCGSNEHAIENCPHNFFNNSCENCGSKNHSTADCPHHLCNQPAKKYESTYQAQSSTGSGNEYAWIGYIIGFVVLVGLAIVVIGTAIAVALSILFTLLLLLPTLLVAYDFWRKKDKEIEHKYFKFLNFLKKPSFELPFLFVSVILGLYLAFFDSYLLRLNSLHRNLMSNFHIGDITFYLNIINLIASCFALYLLVKHYIKKNKGEEEFQQKQTIIKIGVGILSLFILGWYCFRGIIQAKVNSSNTEKITENTHTNVISSNSEINLMPLNESDYKVEGRAFYFIKSFNQQSTFIEFNEATNEGVININGKLIKLYSCKSLNGNRDFVFSGKDVTINCQNTKWNSDVEGDCSEGVPSLIKVYYENENDVDFSKEFTDQFWLTYCQL